MTWSPERYRQWRRETGRGTGEARFIVTLNRPMLEAMMRARDMQAKTLADRIGCHPTTLSKQITTGRLSYYRLDAIANELGVHPVDLMELPDELLEEPSLACQVPEQEGHDREDAIPDKDLAGPIGALA